MAASCWSRAACRGSDRRLLVEGGVDVGWCGYEGERVGGKESAIVPRQRRRRDSGSGGGGRPQQHHVVPLIVLVLIHHARRCPRCPGPNSDPQPQLPLQPHRQILLSLFCLLSASSRGQARSQIHLHRHRLPQQPPQSRRLLPTSLPLSLHSMLPAGEGRRQRWPIEPRPRLQPFPQPNPQEPRRLPQRRVRLQGPRRQRRHRHHLRPAAQGGRLHTTAPSPPPPPVMKRPLHVVLYLLLLFFQLLGLVAVHLLCWGRGRIRGRGRGRALSTTQPQGPQQTPPRLLQHTTTITTTTASSCRLLWLHRCCRCCCCWW